METHRVPAVQQVLSFVAELLRQEGPQLGSLIGQTLRREFPDFTPDLYGFPSLKRLLLEAADNIVAVGRQGADLRWALGESLDAQSIDHALRIETTIGLEDDSGPPAGVLEYDPQTEIKFVNFRGCRDTTLKLAESGLTVLVGPNGAGKSTVLLGTSYASQVTRQKIRALFSGPRDIRRLRTSSATSAMELALCTKNTELRLSARPDDDDLLRFTVSLSWQGKNESWSSDGPAPKPPLYQRPISALFWPAVYLRFRPEALSAPSDVEEGEPRLAFDGRGLPSLLAYLANTDPDRLRLLVNEVQKVVPDVEETRQTLHGSWQSSTSTPQYRLEVKMKNAGWIPADLLSEGTLFAFGMHAVLQQKQPPRLLLMDDIDRGLHPQAQRTLIRQVKELASPKGVQIIVSTHSPYVLDEVPATSVRVVRSESQGTYIRRLDEHPEWEEWKSSMNAGEFWTYVGEDWLAKPA